MTSSNPDLARFMQLESIEGSILSHLKYMLGKTRATATIDDLYMGLARTVRDLAIDGMLPTQERYRTADVKMIYYLSMEFLMGRALGNNLINLGLYNLCRDAVARLGYDIEEVREREADAALGNGGLGRLAACFLDSMATLGIPGFGYGINYEYGLFKQEIDDGWQVERPDQWLAYGSAWEIERPDEKVFVPYKGYILHEADRESHEYNPMWLDWQTIVGVPYDMPIVGFGGRTVNRLRLYAARASDEFNMRIFNEGDYARAVQQKIQSETVSKILYPNDLYRAGQELRLTQEYFLVACAVRDIVHSYKQAHSSFSQFPEKVAIQLNDTHPALAVAELMRILVDEEDVPWLQAWQITTRTFGYTNHTLMPEALEKWPVSLMRELVPRHLEIIYEVNRRFLQEAAPILGNDPTKLGRVSLIEEDGDPKVRMANLAIVGSHSVNGVAAIHTELLKQTVVHEFAEIWPEKFNNKTNGITPRRWLLEANPQLAGLITDRIGSGWITDLEQLAALTPLATDPAFQREFREVKHANKIELTRLIRELVRVTVNPESLFDVQAKRLHEYKRQLLNALHVIHLYLDLLEDPNQEFTPRTNIFAAKAAPGYTMAKLIIKLINNIGAVVNRDPRIQDKLKCVFLPDYRVTLAEELIPGADVSEQISTAGKEASGTGNMKLALNGALTVGTLDGANVEIRDAVGAENIYIFGLTVEEIGELRRRGYNPWEQYQSDARIRRVLDALGSEMFCPGQPGLFAPIVDSLLNRGDEYFVLADLPAYIDVQERVARDFRDPAAWSEKAIRNVAGMGVFSSDRTVTQYAREIWGVEPLPPE
jgi:starch phosphorylase